MKSSPAESPVNDRAPEVLRGIGRLEVRAQRVVEGFLSGRHDSPYVGRSLEFREHRQYVRGDDLRHVDWKAWGRRDKLFVKQFDEETNLRANLLVDCSASMHYKEATREQRGDESERMSKHEYAATAACVLAYLFTRQHDAVGCVAFSDRVLATVPPRNQRSQVAAIADAIPKPVGLAKTNLDAVLTEASAWTPKRSVLVLISDLLCDVGGIERGLGRLAARGVDVLVLQVMSDDELDFPFDSPVRFRGLESDEWLDANPKALRRDYLTALGEHLAAVRTACARCRAEHRLIRTSESLDAVLVALLAQRMAAKRR